jgi:hypothetical protein
MTYSSLNNCNEPPVTSSPFGPQHSFLKHGLQVLLQFEAHRKQNVYFELYFLGQQMGTIKILN